jgi:hypothetical protein
MARNRITYPSLGVFASNSLSATGTGSHAQLRRVQSFNSSFEIARTSVTQFGQQAAIQKIVTEPPTVSADFSYYLSDGYNERLLGLYCQDSSTSTGQANFVSGAISSASGVNLYIPTCAEGTDLNFVGGANAALSGLPIRAFGNCFITNYELNVAVGDIPTVSISLEAANTTSNTYTVNGATTGTINPAVNPANGVAVSSATGVNLPAPLPGTGASIVTACRPADISLSFGTLSGLGATTASSFASLDIAGGTGIRVQSASLSVPLSRSPIQQIGSRFPFARAVDFPITATLTVNALANEAVTRSLSSMLDDESVHDITLTINKPNGSANMAYTLKGAQFVSEQSSLGIGDNQSIDLTFEAEIGGINNQSNGLFVSGSNVSAVFA